MITDLQSSLHQYQEFVKHFIYESKCAYDWAWSIGDKEFMKHKVCDSHSAYYWAWNIGDINDMKQIVKENGNQHWIEKWNNRFKYRQI